MPKAVKEVRRVNEHQSGEIRFITFPALESDPRIAHGIFQRHGGCSPEPWKSLNLSTTVGDSKENVIENRIRIMCTLGFPEDDFFDVWQVHSATVVVAENPRSREQNYIQADAILTNKPGVVLLMRFADCVPILFYDQKKCVIGLAHAGWMGTVNKITKVVVEKMKQHYGSRVNEIQAFIGPSISMEKYPIGPEVAEKVKSAFPASWRSLISERNNNTFLDLWKSNEFAMREAGVEQITISGVCTASNSLNWFSHRAEKGKTGRFAVLFAIGR
jgi:polyphenol oxidase